MYSLLKMVIFHCYVSLPEGTPSNHHLNMFQANHLPKLFSRQQSPWFWVWSFLQLPGFPGCLRRKMFFSRPDLSGATCKSSTCHSWSKTWTPPQNPTGEMSHRNPPNKSPQVQGLQTFLSSNNKYTKYRPNCRIWEGRKVQYTKDLMLYHTQCILGLILEMDSISRVNHHCGSKSGDPMNGWEAMARSE